MPLADKLVKEDGDQMFPNSTKILVIDDMMTMRKIVKKSLGELGYTNIVEADDGETAWPIIEKAVADNVPFDLIISDWNMPKLKGIDLLRKVRAVEAIKAVPFILLTAESEKTQVIEAVKAGVTNYITKPFTVDTLRDKLNTAYATMVKKKLAAA